MGFALGCSLGCYTHSGTHRPKKSLLPQCGYCRELPLTLLALGTEHTSVKGLGGTTVRKNAGSRTDCLIFAGHPPDYPKIWNAKRPFTAILMMPVPACF